MTTVAVGKRLPSSLVFARGYERNNLGVGSEVLQGRRGTDSTSF